MKKALIGMLAAGMLAGGAAYAAEGEKGEGKAQTMEGEVLDMACYMGHEAKGKDHAKCAKKCALAGSPIGLLTGNGSVYLLVDDHGKKKAFDDAKNLAGSQAKITGQVAKRGSLAAIIVEKAEKK